jgi:uncharacterized membrane protein
MEFGNRATGAAELPVGNGKRILGIDAARALAMIGMLAVHVGPEDDEGLGGRLYALAHGRASVLFVLLAGIGIALLSSRLAARAEARLRLFWYAVLLLPLGLVLQALDQPIAVILHHYGAFFVFGLLVLGLPRNMLLGLAMVMTVLGPCLYFLGRLTAPELFDRQSVSIADGPLTILGGLLIWGPYPLLTWSAPLLWGIWLGRQDLRGTSRRRLICLAGLGIAVAAAATSELLTTVFGEPATSADWRHLLADTPHSQMPLWLISATGSALVVLGAALILADRFRTWATPFVALGQLALTFYVAHVLALYWWRDVLTFDGALPAAVTVTLLTTTAMAFALAWRAWLPRGPVEALIHLPWQLLDRTLPAASGTAAAPERPPASATAAERERLSAAE